MIKFLSFVLFLSCASNSKKEQDKIYKNLKENTPLEAMQIIEKGELKKDKKTSLLYLMERGLIELQLKDYQRSSQTFEAANELVGKLYTKSVTEQIAKVAFNSHSDSFYGSIFERSLLYYYQALSYYKLSKTFETTDPLRKLNLNKTRSVLLAWDSFFQDLSRSFKTKTFFQYDIFSKIFAANFHLQLGSRSDKQIALQLYKDARQRLPKVADLFKEFNRRYKESMKSYLSGEDKRKTFDKTPDYTFVESFIKDEITRIQSALRNSKKQKRLQRVILSSDRIATLKSKKYSYTLRSAVENSPDSTTRALILGIGLPAITYFATGTLGLSTYSYHSNGTYVYRTSNINQVLVQEAGIEFELPEVEDTRPVDSYVMNISKGKSDEVLLTAKMNLLLPLSNISYIENEEKIKHNFQQRSLRIATKYLAAIAAAYTTFHSVKSENGAFFAQTAAIAQFVISSKAILASEAADTRSWSNIPSAMYVTDISLPAGEYKVKFSLDSGEAPAGPVNEVKHSGFLIPISQEKSSLFHYRIF